MTTFAPEVQSAPSKPPPAPPKRTAVGTDDEERRPCRACGHTKSDHLSGACRAASNLYTPQFTVQVSGGATLLCGCRTYTPREDR